MKIEKIEEIIATRDLYLANDNSRRIVVEVGKPVQFPDSNDYYCPYKIVGLGRETVKYAGGIDAIQAIQLAMSMIEADLCCSTEAREGLLRWVGNEDGELGFSSSKR